MIKDFLARYQEDLIKRNTDEVTDEVTDRVTKGIAKNLKDVLTDQQIAERTGLPIETVSQL